MFNSLLIVCTGNICRSPVAAYLFWQQLGKTTAWTGQVTSAGIAALVGQGADETAQAMMLAQGIDMSAHRATQLTLEHLRQADLVLVMERHQRQAILDMDPTARGKTFLLGHWLDAEIPDPYQRGEAAHRRSIDLIVAASKPWIDKLLAGR